MIGPYRERNRADQQREEKERTRAVVRSSLGSAAAAASIGAAVRAASMARGAPRSSATPLRALRAAAATAAETGNTSSETLLASELALP